MLLPVADYLQDRDGERPVGVYGLLDSRHNLQYVGFSRNMVLSVKARPLPPTTTTTGRGRRAHRSPMLAAAAALPAPSPHCGS